MKSVTKTYAAFEELRQAIYSGDLKPGQPLRVGELADRLGLSPTPVREALRLLQAAGLVLHQPHRGMVVRTASVAQDKDIYGTRLELEPLAAEKAAIRATPEQLAEISRSRDRMLSLARTELSTKRRVEQLREAQVAMMRAIHAASNSALLVGFIERLWAGLPEGRPWCQWEDLVDDQIALVDAIVNRQAATAKTAMRRYLTDARAIETRVASQMAQAAPT